MNKPYCADRDIDSNEGESSVIDIIRRINCNRKYSPGVENAFQQLKRDRQLTPEELIRTPTTFEL